MAIKTVSIGGEDAMFCFGNGETYGYPREEGLDYCKEAKEFRSQKPSLNHTIQAAKEKQAETSSALAESRRRKEPAR